MNRMFLTVFLGWALYGCAEIPARIAHPPSEDDLQLDKALANINENIDQSVRWGGTVLTVSKDNEEIWIEIQQRGLDQYGAPRQRKWFDGTVFGKNRTVTRGFAELDRYGYHGVRHPG